MRECGDYAHDEYNTFNVFYVKSTLTKSGGWYCAGFDRPGNGAMPMNEEYFNIRESFQYGKPKNYQYINYGHGEQR